MKKTCIILVVLVALIALGFIFQENIRSLLSDDYKPVACPAIAKICPDGTSVGMSGPKCEFAPCPTNNNPVSTQETSRDIKLKMGETGTFNDFSITLNKFTDSRCPTGKGIVCVWAGALNVEVTFKDSLNTDKRVFTSDKMADSFGSYNILISTEKIPEDSGYLTFHVTKFK